MENKDLLTIYRLNPDNDPYLTNDGALLDIPQLGGYHSPAEARAI